MQLILKKCALHLLRGMRPTRKKFAITRLRGLRPTQVRTESIAKTEEPG
jgi:hypothetical protein